MGIPLDREELTMTYDAASWDSIASQFGPHIESLCLHNKRSNAVFPPDLRRFTRLRRLALHARGGPLRRLDEVLSDPQAVALESLEVSGVDARTFEGVVPEYCFSNVRELVLPSWGFVASVTTKFPRVFQAGQ